MLSVAMPWARRLRAHLLIRLASCCPGPSSKCAVRLTAARESLKTATIFTPCSCSVCLVAIATSSASPIAHCSGSKRSVRPVPSKLRRDLHTFSGLHTAAAPTWPSSERDPSVHHIRTPVPIFAARTVAPALRGTLGCSGVQSGGPDHWIFARGRPVHAFGCPAMLMLLPSVSNGSGPSLRVRVRVQTEPFPNWRSGSSINPNCPLGYGSMVNSQPV